MLLRHTLAAQSVERAVENLLPGAEIQRPVGNGDHDFSPHDGAFQVGVGIVLGSVVCVLGVRMLGGELFEPFFEVAASKGSGINN